MEAFEALRNAVKERYEFSTWAGKTKGAAERVSRGFLPRAEQIQGYTFERRVGIPGTSSQYTDYYRKQDNPAVRMAVTIYEYDSVLGAHERLVDLLAACTAPNLPRAESQGLDLGDIAFSGHGEEPHALFFARQNVVVEVRSVGSTHVSVKELAEAIDRQIREYVRS